MARCAGAAVRRWWWLVLLAGCETFTGPKTPPCHWQYTKYELRWDTGALVAIDSALVCRHDDQH